MIFALAEIARPMPAPAQLAGWSPEEIKGSLPVSQREIARRANAAPSTVTRVIRGEKRSLRVEAAIARSLKVPASEVFPGRPNPKRRERRGKGASK